MSGEVEQVVVAELRKFFQHMKATIRDGLTYEQWIRDGIDWYCNEDAQEKPK